MPKPTKQQAISLGGVVFITKKSALDHARKIRDAWPPGDRISGADEAFLVDYLAQHPEFEDKAGPPPFTFETAIWSGPGYSNKGFAIRRADGSISDISMSVWKRSHASNVLAGFRYEINDLIRLARSELGAGPDDDIDHVYPRTFSALVDGFLSFEGLTRDDVAISPPARLQTTVDILDKELVARFIAFHKKHATLEVISSKLNRKYGARPR